MRFRRRFVFLEVIDAARLLVAEKFKGFGGGFGVEYVNNGRVSILFLVFWF